MSINSAMLAGVSGLAANSAALAAISDNISNVNTVGYKDANVDFESLVTSAGTSDTGISGGVTSRNSQLVTAQGTPTQTSSATDLAISGNGLFITEGSPGTVTPTTSILYTRAGSFTPDSSGYLKNTAGLYLLGWPADAQGNVATGSSLTNLQPINVATISSTVSPTTSIALSTALDAGQTVSQAATDAGTAAADAYNPASATTSMTAYNASTGTGTAPDYSQTIVVSDSLGGEHTLQVDYLKSSTPNQWDVEVQSVPTSDVQTDGSTPQGQIASGTVTFDTSGNLVSSTLPASLTIGASATAPTAGAPSWASNLGVAAQTITLNLSPQAGTTGVTQQSNEGRGSAAGTSVVNGTPFGNLSSVAIGNKGLVTATFDNGTSRVIGQVALATFPNENGLASVSGDAYQATTQAGAVSILAAGSGGAGTLDPDSLESSTVDLSLEFTNLIITQRAYSASSKVITTADNMTQDLLAIIR